MLNLSRFNRDQILKRAIVLSDSERIQDDKRCEIPAYSFEKTSSFAYSFEIIE